MDRRTRIEILNLIKLLDAESPEVRARVRRELSTRADAIADLIEEHGDVLPPEIQFHLHELHRLREKAQPMIWPEWLELPEESDRLEAAMCYLADFQEEAPDYPPLGVMLDNLADEVRATVGVVTPEQLARALFSEGRLAGAERDYYDPLSSHLPHVLARGRGLPISLALIFMLTGARFGLEISGVNLPGHFLARAEMEGELLLFDCFNRGSMLSRAEINALSLSPSYNFQSLITYPPSAHDIIGRVLHNLINAYARAGEPDRCRGAQTLYRDLQRRLAGPESVEPVDRETHYGRGQIVRHRRYGYRGVVVEVDTTCRAGEAWYRANLTQPQRDQPWYHVLVDGSTATTYAAQTSLVADGADVEVRHPLIGLYFSGFTRGRYTRNETPWTLPS